MNILEVFREEEEEVVELLWLDITEQNKLHLAWLESKYLQPSPITPALIVPSQKVHSELPKGTLRQREYR